MAAIALTPQQERSRSRWRIGAALGIAVALVLVVAAWQHNAAEADVAVDGSRPSGAPLPAGDASLGRGMATAEFSAAFAKQLRDELDRRAAELKSAGARELDAVKAEVAQQNVALRR